MGSLRSVCKSFMSKIGLADAEAAVINVDGQQELIKAKPADSMRKSKAGSIVEQESKGPKITIDGTARVSAKVPDRQTNRDKSSNGSALDSPQRHLQKQPSSVSTPGTPRQQGQGNVGDDNQSVMLAVSESCPPALRRDTWNVQDFDLRNLMYNGNISMVYHAVDKHSGITVALKLYKRHKLTQIERHQVAREIKLHTRLAHHSVIGMYAAWKDRSFVYIALEWAPGGDVYGYLRKNKGRLPEDVAVPLIMEPFLSGLSAIHNQGLIHRDIKPENILLNSAFQIKIADVGLSIDSNNEVANTRLGTIDYLAPEILDCPVKQTPFDNKENPNIGYDNKVDCWSCGVLAYELLTGQPPFASGSAFETLHLIRTKQVQYPYGLSSEAVSFMQLLLVRDPTQRATIAEALQHPWILKYSKAKPRLAERSIPRRNSMPHSQLSQAVKAAAAAQNEVVTLSPAQSAQQPGQSVLQQRLQGATAAAPAAGSPLSRGRAPPSKSRSAKILSLPNNDGPMPSAFNKNALMPTPPSPVSKSPFASKDVSREASPTPSRDASGNHGVGMIALPPLGRAQA